MLLRQVMPQLDMWQVVALIDSVLGEYGDGVCLDGADADLLRLEESYLPPQGDFVVLQDAAGAIVGCHALKQLDERRCTFRRLYLHASMRGVGLGAVLMDWAEQRARELGLGRVEFWSDQRFQVAHRFFARRGYEHDGRVREMTDGALPYRELFFAKDL